MDNSEKIWVLISRNISGEASADEKLELLQLLEEQPALQQQYDLLEQLWKTPEEKTAEKAEPSKVSRILQLAAVQETLRKEPELPSAGIKWKRVYRIASMFTAVVLAIWAINNWAGSKTSNDDGKIVARKGTKTRTILPDGSTVWLNAGSTIEYEPGFTGNIREVTLYGEAYFDVAKNPNRPFIVHTGSIDIKVLGTAFNVKSYPGDKTIETTLIHGLVEITRKDARQQKPIFLHPNQKIVLPTISEEPIQIAVEPVTEKANVTVKNSSLISYITHLDSNKKQEDHLETAWVYNRLLFRGDSFSELAKKLERWYDVTVHFEDEAAKKLMFNGSIENETVEQAFLALKTAVPFNFKIKNNEIYVSSQ